MGDPNVDLAFQNVLISYLKENYKTIFTDLGTFPLYTVNNAFQ